LDVLTRIKRGHVRIGVNLKGTSEDFSLKGDNISAQGFNPGYPPSKKCALKVARE
jgi:hypothetical protein